MVGFTQGSRIRTIFPRCQKRRDKRSRVAKYPPAMPWRHHFRSANEQRLLESAFLFFSSTQSAARAAIVLPLGLNTLLQSRRPSINTFYSIATSNTTYHHTMLSQGARILSRRALPRLPTTQFMAVQTRGYHENIVEHYENPRNVGSLDKTDSAVGTVSKRVA